MGGWIEDGGYGLVYGVMAEWGSKIMILDVGKVFWCGLYRRKRPANPLLVLYLYSISNVFSLGHAMQTGLSCLSLFSVPLRLCRLCLSSLFQSNSSSTVLWYIQIFFRISSSSLLPIGKHIIVTYFQNCRSTKGNTHTDWKTCFLGMFSHEYKYKTKACSFTYVYA